MPRNSQLAFRRFSRHFVILPVFTSCRKATSEPSIGIIYDVLTPLILKPQAQTKWRQDLITLSTVSRCFHDCDFFLGRLFLFCKQLTDQVSFSLSWIRYLCMQFTSTLTLQLFGYSRTATIPGHLLRLSLEQSLYFVATDSPHIDSYLNLYTTATSPQRQRPLKHVPNCENNFSTTAIFFSD